MRAFTVPDVRLFMQGLLTGRLFYGWQFRSAQINVINLYEIDGRVNTDYITDEEKAQREAGHKLSYLNWDEVQSRVRSLILGGHTPTMMNLTLALDPSMVPGLDRDLVDSVLLNIRFGKPQNTAVEGAGTDREGSADTLQAPVLTLITGISMKTFTMDKSQERLWDEKVPGFFERHNIPLTE
ncbi:MAG TPA: hypothetical protein DEP00_01035 [Lachnospiraceae bacterium]|nr:hypothetical protein [Lachnospiraceae bacterium]